MSAFSHIQRMQQLQQQQRPSPTTGRAATASVGSYPHSTGGSIASYRSAQPAQTYPGNGGGHTSTLGSVASSAYPSKAPSMGFRSGSYSSLGRGMGARTGSRSSLGAGMGGVSRSLRASKASLASVGKSSIQQEYHDRKVVKTLHNPWFGQARTPFIISMIFFALALVCIAVGVAITVLRAFGNIFLSLDKGEIIGPIIIASSILFVGIAIKFLYDAYQMSGRVRSKMAYKAANASMVSLGSIGRKRDPEQTEKLVSGTASTHAITRTPVGSRTSLADVF